MYFMKMENQQKVYDQQLMSIKHNCNQESNDKSHKQVTLAEYTYFLVTLGTTAEAEAFKVVMKTEDRRQNRQELQAVLTQKRQLARMSQKLNVTRRHLLIQMSQEI